MNLVIGIDYTSSNNWSGKLSFHNRSLHFLSGHISNPYQRALKVVSKLYRSDSNNSKRISAYGFGCARTRDKDVFRFTSSKEIYLCSTNQILEYYRLVTESIQLGGPTSFAPIIYKSVESVYERGALHLLLIIADGQVTNESETMEAIVYASNYPLYIVVLGVGDGPWENLRNFHQRIPTRRFNNFKFLELTTALLESKTQDIDAMEVVSTQVSKTFKFSFVFHSQSCSL